MLHLRSMISICLCIIGFSLLCSSSIPPKQQSGVESYESQEDETTVSAPENTENRELPDTMVIAMCGDIMMGTTYPENEIGLPANDGKNLFDDTKAITLRADLAVGNLEGCLLDGGRCRKGTGENIYAFRMPTKYGVNLQDAGFDFMSLANNHSKDFYDDGIISSERVLDSLGIGHSGVEGHNEYAIVKRNGVRYGICAFGHNSYTINHTNLNRVKSILSALRPKCDILVVSFHGGAEGADRCHLPQGQENFLGENRGNLRKFTHFAIDNGADVVYGHGPHVTRCVEVYKNKFIAYSLGNFCTPYGMSLIGVKGYAPVVEIKINSKGDFISGKIHSFIQKKGVGPRKDPTNAVAKEMKRLTEADIKNAAFRIDNVGNILKNGK